MRHKKLPNTGKSEMCDLIATHDEIQKTVLDQHNTQHMMKYRHTQDSTRSTHYTIHDEIQKYTRQHSTTKHVKKQLSR